MSPAAPEVIRAPALPLVAAATAAIGTQRPARSPAHGRSRGQYSRTAAVRGPEDRPLAPRQKQPAERTPAHGWSVLKQGIILPPWKELDRKELSGAS